MLWFSWRSVLVFPGICSLPLGIGMMGDAGLFPLGVSLAGGLILSGVLLALFYRPGGVKKIVSS